MVLLGGELSDGNYGAGTEVDGALQHVAGRHFVSGDDWWVLVCRDERCMLEPARLDVEESAHHTYDGPDVPGQLLHLQPRRSDSSLPMRAAGPSPGGAHLPPADSGVILAAFKPVRTLAALSFAHGPVTTWWYSRPSRGEAIAGEPFSRQLLPAAERQIRVDGGRILSLRQIANEESLAAELQIEIELDGVRQSLGTHSEHMGDGKHAVELGEVLQWLGDLDGDGRPDLLINHSGYYWDLSLWLSSLAQPGEWVGEAGRFTYSPPDSPGC